MDFFVEMTDTYGGEANYSWVNRFRVKGCTTKMGAMRKVSKETGYVDCIVKDWDSGDAVRYNVRGAAICFFVSWWDEDSHGNYMHLKELS